MIAFNAFLHRQAFSELIHRWMLDQPRGEDAAQLTRLICFNNEYVARYLPLLAERLFRSLHHQAPTARQVETKGDFKDLLVEQTPVLNSRTARLIQAYRANPGAYYRETPFLGTLYLAGAHGRSRVVGAIRIKRIKRLVEKTARRIVDGLHQQVEHDTGMQAVLAPNMLPELVRDDDFLMQRIRALGDQALPDDPLLAINDIAGIKLVLEPSEEDQLLVSLRGMGCEILERERHAGNFRATNLLVRHRPDPAEILAQPTDPGLLRLLRQKGMDARAFQEDFERFIADGEGEVLIELIISKPAELLESEVGCCMHEECIIQQRGNPRYRGHLTLNLEFLLDFMFTVPLVPDLRLDSLPVQVWNRYLPDYFGEVKRRLLGVPSMELNELGRRRLASAA